MARRRDGAAGDGAAKRGAAAGAAGGARGAAGQGAGVCRGAGGRREEECAEELGVSFGGGRGRCAVLGVAFALKLIF